MWTEMLGKGGRLCHLAREGKLRCPLIVRPNAEDVVTDHLFTALQVLQPRWWVPDLLNTALGAERFSRQHYPRFEITLWGNRPVFPRDLLGWEEGSSQIEVTMRWERPATTVFCEVKYGADLSPTTNNYDPKHRCPSDQLIRNIRVGLHECGWYNRGNLFRIRPRDFVQVLIAPTGDHPLIRKYRDPARLLAAIPRAENLKGLPRLPFVGEITYKQIVAVLMRQRRFFTAPERRLIDLTSTYLEFKLAHRPTQETNDEWANGAAAQ